MDEALRAQQHLLLLTIKSIKLLLKIEDEACAAALEQGKPVAHTIAEKRHSALQKALDALQEIEPYAG